MKFKTIAINLDIVLTDRQNMELDLLNGFFDLLLNNLDRVETWQVLKSFGKELSSEKDERINKIYRRAVVFSAFASESEVYQRLSKIDISDSEETVKAFQGLSRKERTDILFRDNVEYPVKMGLLACYFYSNNSEELFEIIKGIDNPGRRLNILIQFAEVLPDGNDLECVLSVIQKGISSDMLSYETSTYPANNLSALFSFLSGALFFTRASVVDIIRDCVKKGSFDKQSCMLLAKLGFFLSEENIEGIVYPNNLTVASFLALGQLLYDDIILSKDRREQISELQDYFKDNARMSQAIEDLLEEFNRYSVLDLPMLQPMGGRMIAMPPEPRRRRRSTDRRPFVARELKVVSNRPKTERTSSTIQAPDIRPVRLFTLAQEVDGVKADSFMALSEGLRRKYFGPIVVAARQTLGFQVNEIFWDREAKLSVLAHQGFLEELQAGFNTAINLMPKDVIVVLVESTGSLYFLANEENKDLVRSVR